MKTFVRWKYLLEGNIAMLIKYHCLNAEKFKQPGTVYMLGNFRSALQNLL